SRSSRERFSSCWAPSGPDPMASRIASRAMSRMMHRMLFFIIPSPPILGPSLPNPTRTGREGLGLSFLRGSIFASGGDDLWYAELPCPFVFGRLTGVFHLAAAARFLDLLEGLLGAFHFQP